MRFAKFVFAAAMAVSLAAPALAQEQRIERDVRVIGPHGVEGTLLSISADGRSEARPDMANVMLGVTTEGATAAEALAENARRANALTQAVRRVGVAERDIQTANVSVNPQYVYGDGVPPRITGYQASNNVNVRVRNLDNLGRVIDASVNAGGTNVNGVSFSHQNPDTQIDAARRDAIAEARRVATLYAEATGMSVHRIIAIQEGGGYSPPMPMPMMAMERMAADASTPISPGEVETRAQVNVTFELR